MRPRTRSDVFDKIELCHIKFNVHNRLPRYSITRRFLDFHKVLRIFKKILYKKSKEFAEFQMFSQTIFTFPTCPSYYDFAV